MTDETKGYPRPRGYGPPQGYRPPGYEAVGESRHERFGPMPQLTPREMRAVEALCESKVFGSTSSLDGEAVETMWVKFRVRRGGCPDAKHGPFRCPTCGGSPRTAKEHL